MMERVHRMNKIYKVIYSKVRNCYVVVSELAKNHSRGTKAEHTARKGTALTAALLLALSCVSVLGAPGVEADTLSNNLIGVNHYYYTGKTDKDGNPEVAEADLAWLDKNAANYNGKGAEASTTIGAITIGMNAVSGKNTITIGDRNALQATQSVFLGSNYDAAHQTNPATGSNLVVVGYGSDATGDGSIAIGSGATADPWKNVSETKQTNANKNNNSIAVGYKAQAENNNIAIGANSVATDKASTATALFTNAAAPTSYVSVGSSTLQRRITNVADGADAHDVATVGQLSQVNAKIQNAKTKYYSVTEGPQIADFNTNADNGGASAWAGMAAGYETGTAGIGSTVVGSYSGVMNTGTASGVDLRGAASISLGTLNLNQNTDTSKTFSGVANSIVGQGNMTTNSNAAIIIGAGNTITDSYKDVNIDTSTMKGSTPADLEEALQKAVPESGAQVMAIGGGNKISKASKTQVVGLSNTVSSTELNYVEGFNNKVTGGTSNYLIGAKNTLNGGSKNIVFGDNHTLSSKSNNVVIGSADSQKELAASDAVVIGHNADVQKDGGVAIGSDSVATIDKEVAGYDPETGKASTSWKSTNAAVSVGKADGTITRQITGVAAGTADTDAVNVAQIKKLASINASNIGTNLKKADGTAADATDITNNKKAWATAIGTGTVTKNDNGSKQLVTGGTVYTETHPTADGNYIKAADSAATNLTTLDTHVKANADKLSDMDNSSVKYDTTTTDGKTTVDKTKITLAGEGGTTITNLKDGVNATDAATVGQLDAKISGVTYKAGNGIEYGTNDKNEKTINAKAGTGITVDATGINVNTGKHLNTNNGKIDVDDSGAVAENDSNLVTGGTVYKALHDGGLNKVIIGTPGKDGKDGADGKPGTIGLVGPAGTNGKDGAVDITIQKGEDGKDGTKGANGVDGKDGINRIVYEDKNGKHQVATMEDGLKFAGDDGKEIAKKLNNTLEIVGGADSTKLTDNNIGVNNVDGKLKIQLAQELTGITSISGSTGDKGAKITLDTTDQNISVNGGSIKEVATNLDNDGNIIQGNENNAANMSDVKKLVDQAKSEAEGNDVDTHVKAGSYRVDTNHQVSMDIVDKNGKSTGDKVTITDVAKASEMGDVSKLNKDIQNDGGTTTVIDAVNHVDNKIGDQKYSQSNTSTSGNKYVQDGDSITSAIGKLDGAVQKAADAAATAGKQHSTVSAGTNIDVHGENKPMVIRTIRCL